MTPDGAPIPDESTESKRVPGKNALAVRRAWHRRQEPPAGRGLRGVRLRKKVCHKADEPQAARAQAQGRAQAGVCAGGRRSGQSHLAAQRAALRQAAQRTAAAMAAALPKAGGQAGQGREAAGAQGQRRDAGPDAFAVPQRAPKALASAQARHADQDAGAGAYRQRRH